MNSFANFNGKCKGAMRRMALNHAPHGRKLKAALFLPGPQQTCVREALQMGLIDRNTFIVAVENDEDTAKCIDAYLRANFRRYHIHCGEIYKLALTCVLDLNRIGKLDYAYIDLCGQLTNKISMWIREELCELCENMAFTFSLRIRQNTMLQRELLPVLRGELDWKWTLKRRDKMCRGANILLDPKSEPQMATLYGLSLALLDGFGIDVWWPYRDTRTQSQQPLLSSGGLKMPSFVKAMSDHFRCQNESASEFARELKKLSDQDRADFSRILTAGGVEHTPPALKSAA